MNYRGIKSLAGGTALDTLRGPVVTNVPVSWTISSADGGSILLPSDTIAFSGMNNLQGDVGDDAFEIQPTGSLSGFLNGGTGAGLNSLSYQQWSGPVTVNLSVNTQGNASNIGGLVSNVQLVTGGAGNDTLRGALGKGAILVGLAGDDSLTGGSQRDLLLGGTGKDELTGSTNEDLLISGTTAYDLNRAALLAIYQEWLSARTFTQRIDNLWGTGSGTRQNADYFLNNSSSDAVTDTVFADSDLDRLLGGANSDWLFASPSDLTDYVGTGSAADRRN